MHNTNRLIREGGGLLSSSMLDISAMNVSQIVSFFGDLLGKSEAAFNSAGIIGKLFYGISTLILKGLSMVGSWITSLTNWLVTAMGGTVPGAGNLTYAQLLIYGAICAVLVWGLRRVWRRIRGRRGYYESVNNINQKVLIKQIREDFQTLNRLKELSETDRVPGNPQSAQQGASANPQAQTQPSNPQPEQSKANSQDTKNINLCSKIAGFISRMAKESKAMTIAFAKDVYGTQNRYQMNKDSYKEFAKLATTVGSGVNGFLARCAGNDQNSFRYNLMRGAFVHRAIIDRVVKGTLFYTFPGLTSLWFGGRVLSARILKSPEVSRMIQNAVSNAQNKGTFLSNITKTVSNILYDKSGNAKSRSEAYTTLMRTLKATYLRTTRWVGKKENWSNAFKKAVENSVKNFDSATAAVGGGLVNGTVYAGKQALKGIGAVGIGAGLAGKEIAKTALYRLPKAGYRVLMGKNGQGGFLRGAWNAMTGKQNNGR